VSILLRVTLAYRVSFVSTGASCGGSGLEVSIPKNGVFGVR
jgi:hypothetical protein